jgi:phosphoribosylaminoimidazolecarboxamide formyltransferase / IMP cyclohydrolase
MKWRLPLAFNNVQRIDDNVKINNVLVSVFDKSNLEILIPGILKLNEKVKIYSTGNSFNRIREILGDNYSENLSTVSNYTGQPEMQGGLVKTLDFKIYLGLLSETYNQDHQNDISRVNGISFDMVVVNLYPFIKTVQDPEVSPESARGNIDIGGPCMLRASAKNYIRVASVCDPSGYSSLVDELKRNHCCLSLKTRFELARKTFHHTAEYDSHIDTYLANLDFEQVSSTYTTQ